jgi:hypothetical protein
VPLDPLVAMLFQVLAVYHSPCCFHGLTEPAFEQGADAIPMLLGFNLCKLSSFLSFQFLCS